MKFIICFLKFFFHFRLVLLLVQPGCNPLAAGGQLSSPANRIVPLCIDLSLGQEEVLRQYPSAALLTVEHEGFVSAGSSLLLNSTPLASIAAHSSQGGADKSRQSFERRKIYLVISVSASIFLNCNLWFFWRSNKIHFANCVRLPGKSVKIWNENSSVIELRVVFFRYVCCVIGSKASSNWKYTSVV